VPVVRFSLYDCCYTLTSASTSAFYMSEYVSSCKVCSYAIPALKMSTLYAAARLVFSARRSECITPLLRELHWLRVPERVTFRLCVLAYHCLHGTAPAYLAESLHRTSNFNTVESYLYPTVSTAPVHSVKPKLTE